MSNQKQQHKQPQCSAEDTQIQQNHNDDYYEEGISLKELLLVLINGKKTIALITVVLVIAAFFGSILVPHINVGTKGEVQTAVQLYFEGITQGNNVDGTKFDVNEIKSAEILKNALDNVALSGTPSVTDLSSCISFQAILPDDALQVLSNISDLKTEELKLERLESLEIHPTTYIVKLNVSSKLGISLEEGRELLDNIVLAYKQWLIDKYSAYSVLANIFNSDIDLNDYDYIEAADLLSTQLNLMEAYAARHLGTGVSFNSPNTGMSASDIENSLGSIRQIQLEQLYAKIGAFYITKDASRVVAVYEQLANEKERIGEEQKEKAASINEALKNYKSNEQTLISSDTNSDPITIKTKSQAYDKLVSNSIAASDASVEARIDKAYYRSEAKRFAAAASTMGPDSKEAKEVEKLIADLSVRLNKWNGIVNQTVKDFYSQETYQQYAEQLIPARDYDMGSDVNLPLNLAIAFVLGLVIGVLVILFREYLKPDMNKEKEAVEHE